MIYFLFERTIEAKVIALVSISALGIILGAVAATIWFRLSESKDIHEQGWLQGFEEGRRFRNNVMKKEGGNRGTGS